MAKILFQVTDDTPVAMMTAGQLKEYLGLTPDLMKKIQAIDDRSSSETPKRYVHGVSGIKGLFNCSYPTAHKLKETIIKPAVKQQGRVIIVDADLALKLFAEHEKVKSLKGYKGLRGASTYDQ